MDTDTYPECGNTVYSQINWTWDYEQNHLGVCGWDSFMVHYFGAITIPSGTSSVRFGVASDDGGMVDIDGVEFGSWYDHGCDVFYSDRVELPTQTPLPLDAWFYENGGGTCFMLFWQLNGDDQNWEIVPWTAFTSETPSSTTIVETTTTVEETTTTVEETTTTVEETTTTVQETTTTVDATTTVPETTVPETTLPETTIPETTLPETTVPQTTVPPTTVETTVPEPPTTVPDATIPEVTIPDPTEIPSLEQVNDLLAQDNLSNEDVAEIVDLLDSGDLAPEQVEEIVTALLEQELTTSQATDLAMSSTVLETVTAEQATEIFQSIDPSAISEAEADAIVGALAEAPKAIKEAFEEEINVFSGTFDKYVPSGSAISVGERRVVVAVSGVLVASSAAMGAMPSSAPSGSSGASEGSSSDRRRKHG